MTHQGAPIAAGLWILAIASTAQAGPLLPSIPKGTISIGLQSVATGLGAPDYAIGAPGDPTRLFVLEQNGLIRVIQNGSLLPTPALNLQSAVSPPLNVNNGSDERGLLGLAFHPDFNTPGTPGFHTLYTYESEAIPQGGSPTYPAPNRAPQTYRNVVTEWKVSASNPNVIDPASRREIISFGKTASNHNGGTLSFGPDGYLYLGTGDGGDSNDVGPSHTGLGGNAQNLSVALGKMLRIDPLNPALTTTSLNAASANGQYRIPADNPFQSAGQVKEIFAYGLRNPYRFSFDKANGQLIVADVGQNSVEEIDRVVKGANMGWAIKEGDFTFNRSTGAVGVRSPGSPAGLIDPITGPAGTLEYDHSDGISITGGFVYRGTAIPELVGKYVFGDLALHSNPTRADGRLFYADLDTGAIHEFLLPQFANGILPNGLTVHGFGQDANGELFVLATNSAPSGSGSIVFSIVPVPEPATLVMAGAGVVGLLLGQRRRRLG